MKKLSLLLFWVLSVAFVNSPPGSIPPGVSSWDFSIIDYQTAQDGQGNEMIVWKVNNGIVNVLQFAYKRVNTDFWEAQGDPRIFTNYLTPVDYNILNYQLLMDCEGNAVLVWQVLNNLGNMVIQAAYFNVATHIWETPGLPIFQNQILNDRLYSVNTFPQVAIRSGKVAVVWYLPTNLFYGNAVQVSVRPPIPIVGIETSNGFIRPGPPDNQNNIITPIIFNVSTPQVVIDGTTLDVTVIWTVINNYGTNVVQKVVGQEVTTSFRGGVPATFPIGNPDIQENIISTLFYPVLSTPVINDSPICSSTDIAPPSISWLVRNNQGFVVIQTDPRAQ